MKLRTILDASKKLQPAPVQQNQSKGDEFTAGAVVGAVAAGVIGLGILGALFS